MARKKFIRRNWDKYKRLGRKKSIKWRRPRGRHGKMREERKGYPSVPKIGRKDKQKIKIKLIRNMNELLKAKKNETVILVRLGRKKRTELENKAKESGIKILNLERKK